MIWIILLVAAILLFYKYLIKPLSYWKDLDVKHKKPYIFIGNMMKVLLRQQSFADSVIEMYKQFPNERYNGYFQFCIPVLVIRDLDLIKQVTVKDFDCFTDHRVTVSPDSDPLFAKNLFNLTGQKWRDMRATLSPAFTGSKMRAMFSLISDCSEQFTNYFLEESRDGNIQEVDMKNTFNRFANDVIATCAFGLKCDSLKEKENIFYTMGKDATNFGGWRGFKMMLVNFCPEIVKILKLRLFSAKISDFFENVIKHTIAERTENNIIRPDMIHLLMEARKGKIEQGDHKDVDKGFAVLEESDIGKTNTLGKSDLTDMDIAAQALIFFFAGFEASSTGLSFMAHELAVNPEIQDRLRREIDDAFQDCKGKITYEAVMQMEYLDMVTSETLRKWSPGIGADRLCTKEFIIEPVRPDEKRVVLEAGKSIFIPIMGIHHDEHYFPNPEKFDPERFSETNKHNIVPYSYLPFGVGPRSCIASRFVLMEIKILFVHLLRKFEIVVTKKTMIPLKLSATSVMMVPTKGFWLGLKARTN